ncbi:hypothetical protein V495_01763 [Pseudogymnoascus sp. VKM F-4514 (FW-929)]|nr:hypothetical protein V495_01763 [Pseudogymnoascus sp. VKM F-4514 (FW-929)]
MQWPDSILHCENKREQKKRGKASRKELAKQAAAAANDQNLPPEGLLDRSLSIESPSQNAPSIYSFLKDAKVDFWPQPARSPGLSALELDSACSGSIGPASLDITTEGGHQRRTNTAQIEGTTCLSINGYSKLALYPHILADSHSIISPGRGPLPACQTALPYGIPAHNPSVFMGNTAEVLRLADNAHLGFPIRSDDTSSDCWMSAPSPSCSCQSGLSYLYIVALQCNVRSNLSIFGIDTPTNGQHTHRGIAKF